MYGRLTYILVLVHLTINYNNNNNRAPAQPAIMSVVGLRGTSGANFESQAAVLRGAPEKTFLKVWLPFIFDERDFVAFGEVLRYVLVKGNCCFVFADDKSHAPIYAISLDEVRAVMEDPKNPDPTSVTISPAPGKVYVNYSKENLITVLLKSRKDGSQAYQFTFDTSNDRSLAKRFHDLIENSSTKQQGPVTAAVEPIVESGIEVTAAGVTASVLNANAIGALAASFQPDM